MHEEHFEQDCIRWTKLANLPYWNLFHFLASFWVCFAGACGSFGAWTWMRIGWGEEPRGEPGQLVVHARVVPAVRGLH